MEAGTGAIDDLEPLALLDGQVHQQRAVREVGKGLWRREGSGKTSAGAQHWKGRKAEARYLEGHEFVVGLGSPGVHLHGVLQGDDQELNTLVFHWGQERGGRSDFRCQALLLSVFSPDLVSPWLLCCGILTNTVVAAALHVPHSGPPLLLLHLGVIVQDLIPKPGQVIYPKFVPFP